MYKSLGKTATKRFFLNIPPKDLESPQDCITSVPKKNY